MDFRIFKQLPRLIYGPGSIKRALELVPDNINQKTLIIYDSAVEQVVTSEFSNTEKIILIPYNSKKSEPYTYEVAEIIEKYDGIWPDIKAIVGIGGGSTMDMAKGLSVSLANGLNIDQLQGWDIPTKPGIYKIGIPTIFGSGSEASRTAVFHNGVKKQGINSDYSMFDSIIIDPSLSATVPLQQKIYTAMDCYIHCVESLEGTYINQIASGYAEKALDYCDQYFADLQNDELIAVASYYGGVSIVNSEVGICHALSYGLSIELGIRHGLANCIVFNVLDDYYGEYCSIFRAIIEKYEIDLPRLFPDGIEPDVLDRMVKQTLLMERPLENALGSSWRDKLNREQIEQIYLKM